MTSRRLVSVLALVAAAAVAAYSATRPGAGAGSPASSGSTANPAPSDGVPARAPGYAPKSAAPADAIPGGSLSAHEGFHGAHTIERHVGKSVDDLRRRAQAEGKREVSTFTDESTADRAVAAALYAKRAAVASWLSGSPHGFQPFESKVDFAAGTVYRKDRDRAVPGRTVVVVLEPASRFPEGFAIHTAYVSLP